MRGLRDVDMAEARPRRDHRHRRPAPPASAAPVCPATSVRSILLDQPTTVTDADLSTVVHQLADAVVLADVDGTIVFWNDAAERLFGWSAPGAVGQSFDLIIPDRQRARHWDGYRRVMRTGHTDYGDRLLEVPALHHDGRRLSVAFTVTLLRRAGERLPYGRAAVMRDETRQWQERRHFMTSWLRCALPLLSSLRRRHGPQRRPAGEPTAPIPTAEPSRSENLVTRGPSMAVMST